MPSLPLRAPNLPGTNQIVPSSLIYLPYLNTKRQRDSRELLLSHTPKMAAPEVHHLFHHPIADHSFSADRKTLAVAKDSSLELYSKVGSAFKLKAELEGHDKTITGIDISPKSGRIVTCSQGPYTSSVAI